MAENDIQEARLTGALAKIEARLDGMDRAQELIQQWPTELEKRIGQVKELHDAQLAAIKDAIAALDRLYTERTELLQRLFQKQHEGNKELLEQQYVSSQKAIDKAEESVREQLEKVEKLNTTFNNALSERIASNKDRITAIESRFKGAGQLWAIFVGAASLVIVLLGFIYTMQ